MGKKMFCEIKTKTPNHSQSALFHSHFFLLFATYKPIPVRMNARLTTVSFLSRSENNSKTNTTLASGQRARINKTT